MSGGADLPRDGMYTDIIHTQTDLSAYSSSSNNAELPVHWNIYSKNNSSRRDVRWRFVC